MLKRLWRREAAFPLTKSRSGPPGSRAYAVGDVHGRLDLLDELLNRIEADDVQRGSAETRLIFLGDLVDRGPASMAVVERIRTLALADRQIVCLKGNHEELLIRAYNGDRKAANVFTRVGGRETLLSYGVSASDYEAADLMGIVELLRANVPMEHVDFLDSLPDFHLWGDYLFVHAGIRPRVPWDRQRADDLRWIRRDFLDSQEDHGKLIVHGHSITPSVDEQTNRIGIDTGAYASGRLTGLGLEATERWFLRTTGD